MRRTTGFTILELSVVLALMALLAGVVTVSMNGRLRGAHADQTLEAVRALDQRARHEAGIGDGGVALVLDERDGTFTVEADTAGHSAAIDHYVLPDGLSIERAWVLIGSRRVERKTLSISVAPDGTTPTYGLTIRGEDAAGDPTTTALLVAGVSGQFTVLDDEDDVLDILSPRTRHDAD